MAIFKRILLGALVGGLSGFITFKVLDKSPVVEEITVPTVKEFAKDASVPESEKIRITRLEVDAEQVILFNAQVDYNSVGRTIDRLEQLAELGYNQAYIVLDSPGGSVIDGANLISYIKASKMKIDTVCQGVCASMAAQIHQAGRTRYMTDKSILMFHPASAGVQGSLEQMLNQLNTIKKYVDRLDAEVAARAKIPYETFKAMLVSELWVESVDAIEMGLTDKLVYIFTKTESGGLSFNLQKEIKTNKVNNVKGLRDLQ